MVCSFRFFCDASRSRRLGNLRGGIQDIKDHRWFQEIDYDALLNGRIIAPIIPEVRNEGDSQNFDTYPEAPQDNGETTAGESTLVELFRDF